MVSDRSCFSPKWEGPPDASPWPSVDGAEKHCCTRHSWQSLGAAWTQSPCPISVGLTLTSAQAPRKMCSHPQLFPSNTCSFSRAWLAPQTDQPLHCSGTTAGEKIRPAASKTSSASLGEGRRGQSAHQSKQKPKITEQAAAEKLSPAFTCYTHLTDSPSSFPASPHIYLCMPDAHQTQAFGLDCSAVPILAPTVCLCLPGFHLTYSDPFLRCLSFLTGVSHSFSRLTHPLPHTTDCEQLIQQSELLAQSHPGLKGHTAEILIPC